MRRGLTILVWLAVLALGGVTAVANFRYGYAAGHGLERWVYAIGAAVLDVVKTFLPTLMGTFLVGRLTPGTFFRHIAGWSLWGLGVALSLWCAQGLYAASLADKVGEAEGTKSQYAQWASDKASKEARLTELAGLRTKEAIAGDIAARKLDRLWSRTANCTDATANDSRLFCQDVAKLEAAVSTAPVAADIQAEQRKLRGEVDDLTTKLGTVDQTEIHTDAAAGPKAQAKLLGWDLDFTTAVLAFLIAAGFEGVGLLPWIILGGHVGASEPVTTVRRRREPALDPPATAAVAEPIPTAPMVLPEEDGLAARWAKTALVRRKGSFTPAADMRTDFEAWCRLHGEKALNPTAFGKEMTRLGFDRKKVGGNLRYVDIALLPRTRDLKLVTA
jgi:hypothetical protein